MKEELSGLSTFETPVDDIKRWDTRIDFHKEIKLELQHVPVLPQDALPQIEFAKEKLQLNLKNLEHDLESSGIPAAEFYNLYNEADQLKRAGSYGNYVTGLKIHFGAEKHLQGGQETYTIKAIYQPVIMYPKNNGTGEFTIEVGNYWQFDGTTFIKYVNPQVASDLKDNYKSKIGIWRFGESTYSDYDYNKNDVAAVVFPFQTIYTLILHNLHLPTPTCIYLFNSIREDLPPDLTREYRHCVLMATKREKSDLLDFINKYANRSHLCPPCTLKLELA